MENTKKLNEQGGLDLVSKETLALLADAKESGMVIEFRPSKDVCEAIDVIVYGDDDEVVKKFVLFKLTFKEGVSYKNLYSFTEDQYNQFKELIYGKDNRIELCDILNNM